jgi:hypothetical protein
MITYKADIMANATIIERLVTCPPNQPGTTAAGRGRIRTP